MSTTLDREEVAGAPGEPPPVRSRAVIERPRRRPSWLVIGLIFTIAVLLLVLGFLGWEYNLLAQDKRNGDLEDAQFRAEMVVQMQMTGEYLAILKETRASIDERLTLYENGEEQMDALIDSLVAKSQVQHASLVSINEWVGKVQIAEREKLAQIQALKQDNAKMYEMQNQIVDRMQKAEASARAAWAATNSGAAGRGGILRGLLSIFGGG